MAAAGSTRDVGNRHRAELFFAASEEWGGREVEGQGSNHSVGGLGRRRGEDEGMWLCFAFFAEAERPLHVQKRGEGRVGQ